MKPTGKVTQFLGINFVEVEPEMLPKLTVREPKPAVKLVGQDGNAYVLLGLASSAWKKAGYPKEGWEAIQTEAMNGDYNHLLRTLMKHFEVS